MPIDYSVFANEEISILKKLNTPFKVQAYVSQFSYNAGDRISIVDVMRKQMGDCLEVAAFASVALSYNNIPNFLMDLTSVRDEDHVLCVYKRNNRYGAVAMSKFFGLRFRNPVYQDLDVLAMSYFESYFNFFGEYSMRGHSVPMPLDSITGKQLLDPKYVEHLEKMLNRIKHIRLISSDIHIPRVSKDQFKHEVKVVPKHTRVGKQYL